MVSLSNHQPNGTLEYQDRDNSARCFLAVAGKLTLAAARLLSIARAVHSSAATRKNHAFQSYAHTPTRRSPKKDLTK